jgi:hypothetical protein
VKDLSEPVNNYNRIPVVLPDGTHFESVTACARHFDRALTTVVSALNRGTLDTLGTKHRTTWRPVEIHGVKFRSVNAAATELGLSKTTMRRLLGMEPLGNGKKMKPENRERRLKEIIEAYIEESRLP